MAISHQHMHPKRREERAANDEFVIKTVYKTLDQTFDGPIGGYATLVKDQLATAPARDDTIDETLTNVISRPTEALSETTLVFASGAATLDVPTGPASGAATNTREPPRPSTTSDSSKDKGDDGASAGVKAGIAFGVLGGVLVVALLVYFIFSRRKKKKSTGPENGSEKFDNGSSVSAIPMQANNKAPRVSLRPVTQFFSGMGSDKRTSKDLPPIGLSVGASNKPRAPSPSFNRPPYSPNPFDRPATSQSTYSVNPFGASAERPVSPISQEVSMYSRRSPSPVSSRSIGGPVTTTSGTRQTSMHADIQDMDFTLPSRGAPSPTGTEFSMSSVAPGTTAPPSSGAAAIAAAGGPRNTAVHRVQLDFKPTLEDEMDLKAGDLVRLLHEYDDGWALCIRLDRSRQGVVPRTCLSTRPVKPRAPPGATRNGPPVNPSPFQSGRPESPARPRTATGPGSQQQRQRGPGGTVPGMAM